MALKGRGKTCFPLIRSAGLLRTSVTSLLARRCASRLPSTRSAFLRTSATSLLADAAFGLETISNFFSTQGALSSQDPLPAPITTGTRRRSKRGEERAYSTSRRTHLDSTDLGVNRTTMASACPRAFAICSAQFSPGPSDSSLHTSSDKARNPSASRRAVCLSSLA